MSARVTVQVSFARIVVVALLGAVFALGIGASEAKSASPSEAITIAMLANSISEPVWNVLIPNFERAYPNITVNVSYAPSTAWPQLELTELSAGNAPDLLSVAPGCGSPASVCDLASAGDLAPMIKAPWARRSLPLATSIDKSGQALFAFTPTIAAQGIFTNDNLFSKLGLKLPQTFSQLLHVCLNARADGTVAVVLAGANTSVVSWLLTAMAVATVYGPDPQWNGQLKAGKVTFDGSVGWQQALQEFIDMNTAGCFQAGATGATSASAVSEFAQGQGLMLPETSGAKGVLDASNPQFTYSFSPFPGGTDPNQTRTFLGPGTSVAVNAHSSVQKQAAAQTFINFIARPKQNALYAQVIGGLTQYQFLKGQIPEFMSGYGPVISQHEYVVNPMQSWWNANVLLTLEQDGIGLITGQVSVDDVLSAMDAAERQGPS